MKRIILILTAALLSCTIALMAAGQVEGNDIKCKDGACIEFKSKTHDMGTIKAKDGKVKIEFEFTNVGNVPLVITSANASCGCTQPTYPEEPIRPGKTGVISVTYNPVSKAGEVASTVTVRTNDRKHKKVNLKITGVVIPNQ